MALKFSGAYKQCKPCTGSSSYRKGERPFPDFDTISEGVPYPYIGGASSSSTPAWDFTSSHYPRGRSDPRFGGAGRDSTVSAQSCDVVLEEEDEPKEWMAQVEPGVHITFVSLPNGGNDLKRIRFRYGHILAYALIKKIVVIIKLFSYTYIRHNTKLSEYPNFFK